MVSLNLDILIQDKKFRTEKEKEIAIGKNLLKCIPTKPKRFLGIKVNDILYPLTKEQLEGVIKSNNLASDNYPEAVNELVGGSYPIRSNPTERLSFQKLQNQEKEISYKPIISWFDGF